MYSSINKYRSDIDGLRALAVLAVVTFHAFPYRMPGGFIGVDIFFVISGYLISTNIFENLDNDTFNFYDFYGRRIKRIFPALILVLVTCTTFGWFVLLEDEYKQLGKHIVAGAGFISNFVFWNEAGYFDNDADTKPLLHLWSLGIEEQFYIIWPVLLWVVWRRKFNLITVILGVTLLSFLLNLKEVHEDIVATFYSPITRFWELLSGSLLAWFSLYHKDKVTDFNNKISDLLHLNKQILVNVISYIGFFLLFYGFWSLNKESSFPGKWALVPVLGTMLVILAGPMAWANRIVLSNKIVVWVGLISFPLYLWHWPLLSFARIIESDVPSYVVRVEAVLLSILLAWITYKFVESPIRFGKSSKIKIPVLCGLIFLIGLSGFIINKTDFFNSRTFVNLIIKRKGFEHAYGNSLSWYRGKDDWLFLGNYYDNCVAKLKLAILPTEQQLEATNQVFKDIAKTAAPYNTKVVLIMGPNKSSIYPEFLPEGLLPSSKKYSSFFLEKLNNVPNLIVYNPTEDFYQLKKTEGILYWMTNTHWNDKGAFLAYKGFSNLLGLPFPKVEFKQGLTAPGDLIKISKLTNFPLHPEDNWDIIWENKPIWSEKEIPFEQKSSFGSPSIVTNETPLSDKYVWIVGDSFTHSLKQYFNSTFKEVHYVGHWNTKLKNLPSDFTKAERKPNMIIVVRVERSF